MLPPCRTPRRRNRLGHERGCNAPGCGVRAGSGRPPAADAGDHDVSVEPEQVLARRAATAHDNKAELLEIPAFLRRN